MPSKFKYNIVANIVTDGSATLTKYKSVNSGLTICIAEVNGPLVRGYLTLATEAFDDDGLPHTLEHLVSLGSEKYPYKGLLDMISTRCFSQGTEAYTVVDHTCYKVSTAGDEGFLKILPIYLDHLLFPTLTDSAFTTEVHHINGEGEDAGVMYCEIQDSENSGENRCCVSMLRAMYPGHCGYKSVTNGLMKNLRETTSNEKVHAYHKEFYRPENLSIIIVGQIEAENVFEAIVPIEERILQEGERPKFVRPWQSSIPPLPESVSIDVEYPTDEDEYGILMIAWRGPLAKDFMNVIAIEVLLDYLTHTSVAPFNQEFVEIEDPLCNDVSYEILENLETCVYLQFSSVPVEMLTELKDKVFVLLKDIVHGKEEIDMKRMTALIRKKKLSILSEMEDNPYDHLADCLIRNFLYGSTLEDLENKVKEIPAIEKLFEKDAKFWVDLLKKYTLDGNHVAVLGTPSPELAEKMSAEEKKRVERQIEKLGSEGLKEKAKILKKSVDANEILPPKEFLTSVSVPSVRSIKFPPIKRICNALKVEGDEIQYSVNKMPCRFQVDCIQTNFVRLFVLIDTSHLSLESRMYLPFFIELLYECAIKRNGEIVPYEEVVKQLSEDTISISSSLGFHYSRFFCANYAQTICLQLMVEEEKYVRSVQWVREILFQIYIEPSRIKSTINKMVTDVPSTKESGISVVQSMMINMCFCSDSNQWSASLFRQHAFLLKLLKQLESNPDEVVSKLNEIRECITRPDKMVVHLALNLESLKQKVEPESAWLQEFLPQTVSPAFMNSNIKKCSEYLQPISGDGTKGLIAGVGAIESSFLIQSAVCLIESTAHPDYAPLVVLSNYLTQCEGPMWREIRGNGLAYECDINVSYDTGLIYFVLGESTDLIKAYKKALNIIDSHLNGITKWDTELLESARSISMSEFIQYHTTVSDMVYSSVMSYCRNLDMDVTEELEVELENVSKVTTTQMERVLNKYMKPLFSPKLSRCTVTCNPSKVKDITKEFKKLSRDLTVVPSLHENFMSKY